MRYAEIRPSPLAARFVDRYWFLTGRGGGEWNPVIPDGRSEIIFHLGDLPMARTASKAPAVQGRALCCGQITSPVWLNIEGSADIAAIRLRPEAAGALGPPAAALANLIEPLDSITREWNLLDQLADVKDPRKKAQFLETWLLQCVCSQAPDTVIVAVNVLRSSAGRCRIETLENHTGMTRRHLERLFAEYVGYSPKTLARHLRVQHAARLLLQGQSLTEISQACGYSDQAHMTNDFRRIATTTPAKWLSKSQLSQLFIS